MNAQNFNILRTYEYTLKVFQKEQPNDELLLDILKYSKSKQNIKNVSDKNLDIEPVNLVIRTLSELEYLYEKAIESEPSITRDMKEISDIVGSDLYGLEYRIKSKDSYIEKKIKNGSDYEVKDLIRYTFGVDNPDKYVFNYYEIIAELEKNFSPSDALITINDALNLLKHRNCESKILFAVLLKLYIQIMHDNNANFDLESDKQKLYALQDKLSSLI